MILTIRTDKPEAEIGIYKDNVQLDYKSWHAHRELSATILTVIKELLEAQSADWRDISGIVYYEGPGSFTGLRIGAAVANSIAGTNDIQVANQTGDDWITQGLETLKNVQGSLALPQYGSDPHITTQKK